jgi:dUTP pyrophosphatase
MKRSKGSADIAIKVVRLAAARGLDLPAYQSDGAAGMDLLAAVGKPLRIAPGARVLVPTGLVIELPAGIEAQVRPRSGLAMRNGIGVLNSPGTIDSDYRGELQVLLVNLSDAAFTVQRGARIARLVFQRVERARLIEADQLDATRRGAGGFGSTGTRSRQRTGKSKTPQASKPARRS